MPHRRDQRLKLPSLLVAFPWLAAARFKHLHRCVMAGNPADSAAAMGAGSTEKHIFIISFDAPSFDLLFAFSKRKRRRILENVSLEHYERILYIDRAFAFDAKAAIAGHGQTIFQRLIQPLINALDESFLRKFSHGPVVAHKQVPWRVQPEQRHCMETFLSQLGRKNAVVSQCVAINFAWCFVRQPPAARLIVTGIHLLVTLVAMKRPAPRLS